MRYRTRKVYRHGCLSVLLCMALQNGLSAGQRTTSSPLESTVIRFASQGQFESADRVVETSLASRQPDYELFWNYLFYLVNHGQQPSRAACLGQKWLPAVRNAAPPAQGRILKETGLGVLFGPFRQSHLTADRIKARRLLEESVEVNPRVAEAYIHLAMLNALEGRASVSISMLDRGIETADEDSTRQLCISLRDAARKDAAVLVRGARAAYDLDR